ncbi:universal stress protein [Pseudenhygromyxa sp. WMMC2535]|uniref:universal stress protein n=1 Tax=Pseudenhygromyxa sp. WMMC2535 TaxID=2712867 RepID=UPI0015529862|nr:universal stress protein [Pseudenhygromyxa sp. WMMC2535]NVB38876.1 universal stress protein [Pseudenhygromyxa sp. WMMC2535]
MNRVLVPFDFSPHSRRALALALQGFPFGRDVEIEVLHVVDEDLYKGVLTKAAIPSDDDIQSYLQDDLNRVRAEVSVAHGKHDAPVELLTPSFSVIRGRPHAIIDEHLQRAEVTGCLLGGQGHGGASERLLGRTAQRVIRHATVPVMVIKQPRSLALPARLLAAVDWSENSARALQLAARLHTELGGLLSVAHVIDSPYVPYVKAFAHESEAREVLEQMREEQAEQLQAFVTKALGEAGPMPDSLTEAVVFGDPAETIANQAQTLLADLVIVGAHGQSNLSRFLLGSTSEKLVTAARTDILVVN